jgi:hypothetical protein
MKKETVIKHLDILERKAKRVQNEKMRQALMNAVNQCRQWLTLNWADMLTPVDAKLTALAAEAQPLIEKERQKQAMTEEEQLHLRNTRDIYAIYYAFYQKIYPTAHRALVERHVRQQERARLRK